MVNECINIMHFVFAIFVLIFSADNHVVLTLQNHIEDGILVVVRRSFLQGVGTGSILQCLKQFLNELLGLDVIQGYEEKQEESECDLQDLDLQDTIRDKLSISHRGKTVNFRIPLSLLEMYDDLRGESLKESVAKSLKFKEKMSVRLPLIKIQAAFWDEMIMEGIQKILASIRQEIGKMGKHELELIIVHGTGSVIKLLQDSLQTEFPETIIEHPVQVTDDQALMGSVLFGHDPALVTVKVGGFACTAMTILYCI